VPSSSKVELRKALRNPGRLPDDELSKSVEYDDGSDEAFCVGSGATFTETSLPACDRILSPDNDPVDPSQAPSILSSSARPICERA
jgi:hypothetical protein